MKQILDYSTIIFFFLAFSWKLEAGAAHAAPEDSSHIRGPLPAILPSPTVLITALPTTMNGKLEKVFMECPIDLEDFWCGMATDLATKIIDSSLASAPHMLTTAELEELGSKPALFFDGWKLIAMDRINIHPKDTENSGSIFGTGLGFVFMVLEHPTGTKIGCIGSRDKQSLKDRLLNYVSVLEGGDYTAVQKETTRRLEIILAEHKDKMPEILPHLGFDSDLTKCLEGMPKGEEFQTPVRQQIITVVKAWNAFLTKHPVNWIAGHGISGIFAGTYALARQWLGDEDATWNKSTRVRVFGTPLPNYNLITTFARILADDGLNAFVHGRSLGMTDTSLSDVVTSYQFKGFCNAETLALSNTMLSMPVLLPSWGLINESLASCGEVESPYTLKPKLVDGSASKEDGTSGAGASSAVAGQASGFFDVDLSPEKPAAVVLPSPELAKPSAPTGFMVNVLNPLSAVKEIASTYIGAPATAAAGYVGDALVAAKAATTYVTSPVSNATEKVLGYVPTTAKAIAVDAVSGYLISPVKSVVAMTIDSMTSSVTVGGVVIDKLAGGGVTAYRVTINGMSILIQETGELVVQTGNNIVETTKSAVSTIASQLPFGPDLPKEFATSIEKLMDDNHGLDGSINILMRIVAYKKRISAAKAAYESTRKVYESAVGKPLEDTIGLSEMVRAYATPPREENLFSSLRSMASSFYPSM